MWKKLKTNKSGAEGKIVALAPLAGFTESAFRRLCGELGADLTWTELISANAILAKGLKLPGLYISCEERPLRFQLQGSVEKTLAQAAELVLKELKPEGLDLNAGCPAKKVVKTGAGAALLENLPKLFRIAKALAEIAHGHGVDFSVKFRLGFAEDRLEAIAETLLSAGVDILVLHPRTAKEAFKGKARWERIRDLVSLAQDKASVYGSGDVKTLRDIENFFALTEAQGVLIGRAALFRPWIFKEWHERQIFDLNFSERLALLKRLYTYLLAYRNEKDALRFLKTFAPKFFKGLPLKRKFLPALLAKENTALFWKELESWQKFVE